MKTTAIFYHSTFADTSSNLMQNPPTRKKTELIIFSRKHFRKDDKNQTTALDKNFIEEKVNVRYLGVIFDEISTFQDEKKMILKKWPAGLGNYSRSKNSFLSKQDYY